MQLGAISFGADTVMRWWKLAETIYVVSMIITLTLPQESNMGTSLIQMSAK
jgi:hypothetical protein